MENNIETLRDNFPGNSHKKKAEETELVERTPREKVISGEVRKKKRGFGRKVAESLIEDDTKSVGSYVLYDILIPAAKAMISDMVGGGIEMLLFGERRSSKNIRRDGGRSYTSYGSYYNGSGREREREPRTRDMSRAGRSRHDFDEIIFDTRGEAELVLSHLVDFVADYGQATVADLYDLVGITADFTDYKYGWVDLHTATVSRYRAGYLINLPRTQLLD